jgi:DNA polymerase-3 subunit alpha
MAFGTLEDDTGAIEAVIFPSVYEKYKDWWQVDKAVIVQGKVDLREDALNLVVNEVEEIDENAVENDIQIEIQRGTPKETLMKINQLLKQNPGEQTVVILIPNGGENKRIKLGYGVDYNEGLEKEIKELLSIN